MLKSLFWLSFAGLFYIYLGYPALVWMLARLLPKPVTKAPFEGAFSVVIAAHNEAARILPKIRSLLAADGVDRLAEVLVGSDGSTDGTADVVRRMGDARVRVVEFGERRGKPAVLNDLIPQCRTELVVLTDARQEVAPAALAELLACFADPEVGVVSGELVFREKTDKTAAARGIGFYWEYEKFIRKQESRSGSVPGATGALYALRKSLFAPIPTETLLDDVAIPMQAVARGSRCVFEEAARVYDEPSQSAEAEAIRKRRTIAGNLQLVRLYPGWLIPWRDPIWWRFVSHKLLRLCSPFCLVGMAVCGAMLSRIPVYLALCAGQALFYVLAAGGWWVQRRGRRGGLLGVPFMFLSLNATTLVAVWDALRSRHHVAWDRPHVER